MTLTTPRPEKVASVNDALAKFSSSHAVFVTEYRGLTVKALSILRRDVAKAGGDCKVYITPWRPGLRVKPVSLQLSRCW